MKPEKSIPESLYRKHVLRARSTRNHFTFSREFVFLMSKFEALFLQDIINRASWKKCKRKTIEDKEDGMDREFFLCTRGYLERAPMNWDKNTQARMLNSLKEKGFIRVKKMGSPPKRWLWVDVLKIEESLDNVDLAKTLNRVGPKDPKQGPSLDPIRTPIKYKKDTNVSSNKVDNCHVERDRVSQPGLFEEEIIEVVNGQIVDKDNKSVDTPKEEGVPVFFLKSLSQKIYDHLYSTKKLRKHMETMDPWVKVFQKFSSQLMVQDHLTIDQVQTKLRKDMDLHLKNIDYKFWPKFYSANTICEGYPKIEDAIKDLHEREKEKIAAKDVPVTPDGKEILGELKTLGWPKGSGTFLEQAVERSLLNITEFREKLKSLKIADDKLSKLAEAFNRSFGSTKNYVLCWFKEFQEDKSGWDKWYGKVTPIVINSEAFQKKARSYSQDYWGTETKWNELYTLLKG